MLKRFAAHFALILLFAFVQIGAVSHQISHFSDLAEHSQQDESAQNEQCGQCVSNAEVDSGWPSQPLLLAVGFITSSGDDFNFQTRLSVPYSARAPPQIL